MQKLTQPTSKIGAELLDEMGDTLRIKAAAVGEAFILSPDSDLRFTNDQAPAIALAILTAAGFVPRGNRADSDSIQESVDTAAGYLDDAVLIAAGTAAKKELTRRRDELAAKLFDLPVYELHPGPFDYADSTEVVRNAIDMIIQLQDEASK